MPEEHCKTSSIPFSSIRTVTVGFGVAPNLLTLPLGTAGARGLMRRNAITAGGDFHPAPRTFAAPAPWSRNDAAQCRADAGYSQFPIRSSPFDPDRRPRSADRLNAKHSPALDLRRTSSRPSSVRVPRGRNASDRALGQRRGVVFARFRGVLGLLANRQIEAFSG